jgi:hypothetical protein
MVNETPKTEEQLAEVPVEGFSIDPSTWVEPKESFPGYVAVSDYRWCNQKYLDGVVTRIAGQARITQEAVLDSLRAVNPTKVALIPQWDLRVKRLDTVLQLPDGSQVDAIRYGGYDMVKWNNVQNAFVPINPNDGKEAFISGEWKRIAGQTEPPTLLAEKFFNFDWWPAKRFGGSMPAKRVLVPTGVLPPDFTFTGEVRIIQVPDRGDGQESTSGATSGGAAPAANLLSLEDAVSKLVTDILPGTNNKQMGALVQALTPDMRSREILEGVATGALVKKLEAEGRIVVAADGTISLPA